jgi:photosystem II stability/assembly factor-like uncharacterized protein
MEVPMPLFFTRIIQLFFVIAIVVISAAKTNAQQPTSWNEIVHPPAYLNVLIASGSNLIAGTDMGMYVSTDNGQSWTTRNNGLPVNAKIRALAVLNNSLFAATDTGVWSSVNEGQSWTDANGGLLQNQSVLTVFVQGTTVLAGTERNANTGINGKIFRTTDQGQSWKESITSLPENITSVRKFAAIADTIFVVTDFKIYRSTDNGANWTSVSPEQSTGFISFYDLETSGSVLFASGRTWGTFILDARWTSFDGGNSWKVEQLYGSSPWATAVRSFIISGSSMLKILAGNARNSGLTDSNVYISTNAGKTFANVGPASLFGSRSTASFDKLFLVNGSVYLRTCFESKVMLVERASI